MNNRPLPSATAELPTAADWRRNDLALFATALVLLLLGWGVARIARAQTQSVELGLGLPRVAYPAHWTRSSQEASALFTARNPASAGGFRSAISAATRPALEGDSLSSVRAEVGFERSLTLDRYRELSALPVAVLNGQPALLTTYAWLADPTLDSALSGLPVVVLGQDLIFRAGNQWVIASTAVDAARAADERDALDLFFAGFGLETPAHAESAPLAPPAAERTPAATPALSPTAIAPAPGGGFLSGQPAGVNP